MNSESIHFDIEAMHKIQLGNLKELDRVCRKHNIKYYLAFGTLIGAVRNNGIIPWDDDIDVVVERDDYEHLMMLPASEWNQPYFLQSIESDPECCKCYMKLRNSNTTQIERSVQNKNINHGISIDIYSMIHLSDDLRKRREQLRYALGYMLLTENHPAQNHGWLLKVLSGIVLAVIPNRIKEKLKGKCLKKTLAFQQEETEECFVLSGLISLHIPLKNSYFKEAIPHAFEDATFLIPSGYDDWLSQAYGNYMKLPPENERDVKLDGFVIVDVNRPYTYYAGKYYKNSVKRATGKG